MKTRYNTVLVVFAVLCGFLFTQVATAMSSTVTFGQPVYNPADNVHFTLVYPDTGYHRLLYNATTGVFMGVCGFNSTTNVGGYNTDEGVIQNDCFSDPFTDLVPIGALSQNVYAIIIESSSSYTYCSSHTYNECRSHDPGYLISGEVDVAQWASTFHTNTASSSYGFFALKQQLEQKIPFSYFVNIQDMIAQIVNPNSASFPNATIQIPIGTSGTVSFTVISSSSVGRYVTPSLLTIFRNLMKYTLYIAFGYWVVRKVVSAF